MNFYETFGIKPNLIIKTPVGNGRYDDVYTYSEITPVKLLKLYELIKDKFYIHKGSKTGRYIVVLVNEGRIAGSFKNKTEAVLHCLIQLKDNNEIAQQVRKVFER